MSSAEEIKAMQRHLFAEFFSKGKLEVADETFAPDHVYYNPDTPEGIHGPEGMKQFVVGTFRGAFPDLQGDVEDQIAEGEKVVMRWTARGTHESWETSGKMRWVADAMRLGES